jgi:hypothetical protein
MAKSTYSDLLKSPEWQKKRLVIMKRDKFTCKLCKDKTSTLHIHHKSYTPGKKPWEYPDDNLVTLCEYCHTFVEEAKSWEGFDINNCITYKVKKESGFFIVGNVDSCLLMISYKEDRTISNWLCITPKTLKHFLPLIKLVTKNV